MASDLISRDALVDKTEILYQHTASGKIIPWSAVRVCAINNVPTVDAEPVRHGEWEACGNGLTCKICHKGLVLEQGDVEMNYCPNCGAKMDGGKKST